MRILVACEESQAVTIELRQLGHEAYSCDVQECSGGHPEWHIRQDVLPLLNGQCEFRTQDGKLHRIDGRWDMIIAHPPCTKLSNAGAVNLGRKGCICATPEWKRKFFDERDQPEFAIWLTTGRVEKASTCCSMQTERSRHGRVNNNADA